MSPPEQLYPRELTDHSYEVLVQLRGLVPEMVLIGGWGTWVRNRALPSHDIDVIVSPQDLKAVLAVADESSRSDHLGGTKWRAEVDGIHVDLYVSHRSRLGQRLQLRVEDLSRFAEQIEGWRVLDVDAHAATKLAALLDRPESLPGEKDRRELVALLPAMDPGNFAGRLTTASQLEVRELVAAVERGLDFLKDLQGVGRVERRVIERFAKTASEHLDLLGRGGIDRQDNVDASTWRRGRPDNRARPPKHEKGPPTRTRLCGSRATATGEPCTQVVSAGEDHCRAGHSCSPRTRPSSAERRDVQADWFSPNVDDIVNRTN